jgi:hypothetical protein
VAAAAARLAGIPMAREHPAGYHRDLFLESWPTDAAGCSLRDDLLERASQVPVRPDRCHPVTGRWLSSYDGAVITVAAAMEIDHRVALKEAWDSGAWAWPPAQRHAYALDTANLEPVSAVSNQAKGDKDPSNWLPAPATVCRYLVAYVNTKARYHLSMDPSEWGRTANVLVRRCGSAPIVPR